MGHAQLAGPNVKKARQWRRATGAAEGEQTPEGRNPMSGTVLKMGGKSGEEEVAERMRNPVSGTVVGKVGLADRTRTPRSLAATSRRGLSLLCR